MEETGVWSLIWEDSTCSLARAPQLFSLCSRAWELQLLKPSSPRAHAPQQEKPLQWEAHAPELDTNPNSLQLDNSLRSQRRPSTAKDTPKTIAKGFPGGPEVKNLHSYAGDQGSIPGQGLRSHIPQND